MTNNKILHVGKFWDPYKGGIETFLEGLTAYLSANNFEQTILVFAGNNQRKKSNNTVVIKCKSINIFGKLPISLSYFREFKRQISKHKIIHVHAPNPFAFLVIFLLRKSIAKQNLNLIIHWHSDLVGFHVLYYLFKNLEKFVIEKISTKIITTSHNYIDTSQVLMNSAARIRVIPNFLPVAIQNSHYSKCSEPRSKSFTMLCVGRNTKYKGYDKFIKNLYLMDSDFKLIIVGKDVKKLEKITKNSPYCNMIELKEDVNFNDLLKIYRSADIFVLPSVSRAEAFGIVLLEAMYFGLPSVVFNIPGSGVTEVIRNEINGLTADFLDYPHFFQCINEIRDNESLREQLVFNTKNVILEYDSDTICKRFVDVYNE